MKMGIFPRGGKRVYAVDPICGNAGIREIIAGISQEIDGLVTVGKGRIGDHEITVRIGQLRDDFFSPLFGLGEGAFCAVDWKLNMRSLVVECI